jgi:hypothetical protein
LESVAIWYSGQENSEIDIHINFWKLPANASSFSRFLDIGLNFHTSSKIDQLFLYLPFPIECNDLTDLGAVISDGSANLLTAIFNEDYLITSSAKSDYHNVKDKTGNEIFNIYSLRKSNFSIIKDFDPRDGTVIEIKLPDKKMREERTYIRFRVSGNNIARFSRIEKNVSSILNSAFTKAEIFDFRINATRHLPNKLLEIINQARLFSITKIHFFYICSYRENYILSHRPFFGARRLEDDIWNSYISATFKTLGQSKKETLLAYHWKEKSDESRKIEDFNVLMKTSFRHNNWKTIIVYIIFLLLFSISANLISNYFSSRIMSSTEIKCPVGKTMDQKNSAESKIKKNDIQKKE